MNSKQDNRVKNIWWIVTVFLGALLMSQCSNQPKPPIAEVSTPVVSDLGMNHTSNKLLPGEEVEIWANVAVADQNTPIIYTWSIEGGEIIRGQGTESIIYQAPDTPGDCGVILKVESGDWETEKSTSIVILAPTPTDTPTSSPTATATFTPPPTDTPTPPPSTATFTSVPPTPTPEAVVVAANGLNLRSGPGITYDPPIGYLSTNKNLHVTGRIASNEWIQVVPVSSTNIISGWVSASAAYVQINMDLNTVPIVEPPPSPTPSTSPAEDIGEIVYQYEYGPILYEPISWAVYSVNDIVLFTWERYDLRPDQYYSVRVIRDVPPPEDTACIHIQTREPQELFKLDCPIGAYYWSVAVATKLPEGSEHEWREDSDEEHKNYFGIGMPHPNTPQDGGGGTPPPAGTAEKP